MTWVNRVSQATSTSPNPVLISVIKASRGAAAADRLEPERRGRVRPATHPVVARATDTLISPVSVSLNWISCIELIQPECDLAQINLRAISLTSRQLDLRSTRMT